MEVHTVSAASFDLKTVFRANYCDFQSLAMDRHKRKSNVGLQMLTHILRCFGDKGDVEDITEGQYRSMSFILISIEATLLVGKVLVFLWTDAIVLQRT